jgi:hypothetical protein
MRQAVDAAKDKANEEMPVDLVVAAMTGEFLRPILRVVSARVIARPAARKKEVTSGTEMPNPGGKGAAKVSLHARPCCTPSAPAHGCPGCARARACPGCARARACTHAS